MSYAFIDGYGSILTAESSIVAADGSQRQNIAIASFLTAVPVTITGNTSVSGAVTLGGGAASVSGVGLFNTNHIGNGSILVVIPGSVATIPSPASISGVGIFNTNHIGNGSIIAVVPGSVAVVGSPASVSGVGVFNTNHIGNGSIFTAFRNDTVASTLGADLTSRIISTDSAGRVLIKPFSANEASVVGRVSTNNAGDVASVVAVPAAGAGLRNYLTDILIANTGSVATLITFTEGGASVLGYTIAPANSGSNIIGMNAPIRNQVANQPINAVVGTASSTVYITVLGHRAP